MSKKTYRVYQTISIFVEAENEIEAINKVREDENTYLGWDKWETEIDSDIANDIIDFYPPLNNNK